MGGAGSVNAGGTASSSAIKVFEDMLEGSVGMKGPTGVGSLDPPRGVFAEDRTSDSDGACRCLRESTNAFKGDGNVQSRFLVAPPELLR